MKELNFSKWTRLLVVVLLPFILASCDDSETTTTTTTTPGNTGTTAVDTTGPTLSAVSISGGDSFKYVYVGDTVAIALTASETIKKPTVTVSGNAATVTGSGTGWTAEYTVTDTVANGTVTFSISFADMAGNDGVAVTAVTDGSSVIAFVPAPSNLQDYVFYDNALGANVPFLAFYDAGNGGECNVDPSTATGAPSATCNNIKSSGFVDATETARGKVFEVQYKDSAPMLSLAFFRIAPVINFSNYAAGTLTFDLYVEGSNVDMVMKLDCGYPCTSGDYKPASLQDLSTTDGWKTIEIAMATLLANNPGPNVLDLTKLNTGLVIWADHTNGNANGVKFQVDNVILRAPSGASALVGLSEVAIATEGASNTAAFGDTITINFKSTDVIAKPVVSVAGSTAGVTVTGAGINWQATYVVTNATPSGTATFNIAFTDTAATPTAGVAVTATTNDSNVTINANNPPQLTTVAISVAGADNFASAGETITLMITANEAIMPPTVTIADKAATVTGSGVNWTAAYQTVDTDTSGSVTFSINFKDTYGLAGTAVTATTDDTEATISTSAISLTDTVSINTFSTPAERTLTGFGGNASNIVALTTTEGVNPWSGTILGGEGAGETTTLLSALNFNANSATITVDVWSSVAPGATVLFKVEEATNADNNTEVRVATTMQNQWETLNFDFSGYNTAHTYDKAIIFFNAGVSANGNMYYWDNITLNGNSTDANTDTAAADIPEIPTTFNNLAKNYSLHDFGGNSSQFMAQIMKNNGEVWGGTTIGADNTIAFTTDRKYIAVDIYSPTAGVPVRVKVEDSTNSGIFVELDKNTVTAGWQTLYYDFTGAVNANTYDKISVFPDFGNGSGGGTIYFVRSITLGAVE